MWGGVWGWPDKGWDIHYGSTLDNLMDSELASLSRWAEPTSWDAAGTSIALGKICTRVGLNLCYHLSRWIPGTATPHVYVQLLWARDNSERRREKTHLSKGRNDGKLRGNQVILLLIFFIIIYFLVSYIVIAMLARNTSCVAWPHVHCGASRSPQSYSVLPGTRTK